MERPSTHKIPKLVFIVGLSGSGKTTLSRSLELSGIKRVSASDCLRDLFLSELETNPSRLQLADYGEALRETHNLNKFHLLLYSQLATGVIFAIDGLRFSESIEAVASMANQTRVIFLSCPLEVRRQRFGMDFDGAEFAKLLSHPTELSVSEMRSRADLILDASQSFAKVHTQAIDALREWRMIH
jgi:dephospho-CoA kinase